MKKTTITPGNIDKDKIINPGDVECASDCNEEWKDCQEKTPEKKNVCHTKLAKCVKTCDQTQK
jgi:hypothetical protein